MPLETTVVEGWMSGLFLADATIGGLVGSAVYLMRAPQGAARPFVVISYQQGSDENALGSRALAQPLMQVKALGRRDDIATVKAVANRIDTLLQDTRVVFNGYQIRVQREQIVRMMEDNDGVEYMHVGGMYRCWVSLAA